MLNSDKQYGFVICGQALTGRLEVLEGFFRKRFEDIFIIGISNIYSSYDASRCAAYKNGNKFLERKLLNLVIKRSYSLKGLFFGIAYAVYFVSTFLAVLRFRFIRGGLVFIGIGCFPAIMGIILKKARLIKKVVYYSIDYFPPANKSFLVNKFVILDKLCVKESDLVWLISPRIIEARRRFAGINPNQYSHRLAPLCFDESLLRFRPLGEVERWSLVFAGTPGYFHGLHLLIAAMPKLAEIFPQIKIKIIGSGPWDDIKDNIRELGLEEYFVFMGFIKKEDELFDIVSRNALGLALYVPEEDNPTFYADPGKPKLYAFSSVPIIISKTPLISKEIEASGAGKAIDFNQGALVEAITEILSDEATWNKFRDNAFSLAKRYTSKAVLEPVLKESLGVLN